MNTGKRYKCAVVVPPVKPRGGQVSEYLGAGLIKSVLEKEGYPADLINFLGTSMDVTQCAEYLAAGNYDWIGITAPFVTEIAAGIDLSCALRELNFTKTITMGGVSATLNAEKILTNYSAINSIARGESSRSVAELLANLDNTEKMLSLPGFYFLHNGQIIKNECSKEPVDMNTEPFIMPTNKTPVMSYSSSRGCPFFCTYCCNVAYRKITRQPAWAFKDAVHVVDELERYNKDYGKNIFLFVDDNFFGSTRKGEERALKIAELIIERNLKIQFSIECRVTDIKKRVIRVLKAAGLTWMRLGVESGVQRMLDTWKKLTTVEQNKEALQVLSDLGIQVHINYMFLDPWSTYAEIRENFEFIKKNDLYLMAEDPLIFFSNNVSIIAGTELEAAIGQIDIMDNWNLPTINEKQNNIVKKLKMLYQYSFRDELVAKYLKLHSRWIQLVEQRKDYLEYTANNHYGTIPADDQKKINKWLANYRYQVIRIVEDEIYNIGDLVEDAFMKKTADIFEQFDRQVFEMPFEKFRERLPAHSGDFSITKSMLV